MKRPLLLIVSTCVLAVCFALLLRLAVPAAAVVAGSVTVTVLLGASMCVRALDDGWAAVILGVASVPYAGLIGLHGLPAYSAAFSAANMLSASVAASVAAVAAAFAVGAHHAMFLSIWMAAAASSFGSFLSVLGLAPAPAAGTVVVLLLMASTLAAPVANRVAQLHMRWFSAEPASPAVVADTYLSWMLTAIGLVCTVGIMVLVRSGGWQASALIVAASCVLLIRSARLTLGWRRAAMLVPVVSALALQAIYVAGMADALTRIAVVVALVYAAVIVGALLPLLRGRRLIPF